MFLNEEFLNLYEELSELNEAKADTQRLIDFADEDLANRFLAIKSKLKSPENDLYYWIKNKSVEDLEKTIVNTENTKSKTQEIKDIADRGAELVCESDHWKVYHITTFEASQKYGRDTKWCITGINGWGDRYWKDYTNRGITFYFFIAKEDYNARGEDSKFALTLYGDEYHYEVFNQQDYSVELDEIPYLNEVSIPGVNFSDLVYGEGLVCEDCGESIDEDNAWYSPEGDPYCEYCFNKSFFYCPECEETCYIDDRIELPNGEEICMNCFEDSDYTICPECDDIVSIDDIITNIFGDDMCQDCFEDFLYTDKGYAECFFHRCEGFTEGDFADEEDVKLMISNWNSYKYDLDLSAEAIVQYEKDFIENALECDGVVIDPSVFTKLRINNINTVSYNTFVEGTNKKAENSGISQQQALNEIINFINGLSVSDKENFALYIINDEEEPGDKQGDVTFNIDPPSYFFEELEMTDEEYEEGNMIDPVYRIVDNTALLPEGDNGESEMIEDALNSLV